MNRQQIISAFLSKKVTTAKASSLRIEFGKLFSYQTCIAQHTADGRLLVNMTKYSQTTSVQQNALLRAAADARAMYGVTIPRGTDDLLYYAGLYEGRSISLTGGMLK